MKKLCAQEAQEDVPRTLWGTSTGNSLKIRQQETDKLIRKLKMHEHIF
jgi:hypothetical protein